MFCSANADMRFESNISGVIAQVERLKERIPIALERALAPKHWHPEARALAQRTLLAIAEPVERRFISAFVDTVAAGVLQAGGLALTMRSPFPALRNILTESRAARQALAPADRAGNLFLGQVQDFEDLILQWVETPFEEGGKRRDSRDWGKSDEDIAHLISYIMLSSNLGIQGLKARDRLTPHIESFLRQSQADRLPPATVDQWLRAVLAAWRELVRVKYPLAVRLELQSMSGELLV